MDQTALQKKFVRRLRYAFRIAEKNMTPEGRQRAIETVTLPEFLLELAKWIPAGNQEPEQNR